ncbi:adenylate/guanylate cyclase domain-containing protein [Mobilicoccus pelagius]|uniref:Adenylate cyclase n=1 Tax=Mobilicoccus pelagius NBRC 104925 TaxID=1089455 RepID=H5UN25_9MICO|nr:adenylate/guanylate cyclase domain-containing protein [Mobilicoccus pelagius]GAB47133.1 adenylate cyclase [Mobilicoccus pelagius NBRC 104925]
MSDEQGDPGGQDATDHLLGRPRTLGRRQVSAAAGVPLLEARRFWHALGFPGVGDDATSFTDADVEALRHMVGLVRSGRMHEPLALSMTRAIARTTDRLAAWQSSLLLDAVLNARGAPDVPVHDIEAMLESPSGSGLAGRSSDDVQASHVAGTWLMDLVDELEPLMVYAWRRHLSAALNRLFSEGQSEDDGKHVTVGFADMVGFTTLVTRLSDQQLGRLVGHFEALASDVVTAHGGRIVKTIGDEVFFVVDRVDAGVDIATDLLEALREDPAMPRMRVGLASGEVLSHLGDVFGTPVNRASRITEVAQPDTIVVDEAIATELGERSAYTLRELEPRPLRGLGVTRTWLLERGPGEQPATRRRVVHRPPMADYLAGASIGTDADASASDSDACEEISTTDSATPPPHGIDRPVPRMPVDLTEPGATHAPAPSRPTPVDDDTKENDER